MDYQKIFVSLAVVLVGIFGSFSIMTYWNVIYDAELGNTFNETSTHIQSMTAAIVINKSLEAANSTYTTSGGSEGDTSQSLTRRSLNFITILPGLLGIFPALIEDAAIILDIPPFYVLIGTAIFLFSFALLTAYLLLIGVKRLP